MLINVRELGKTYITYKRGSSFGEVMASIVHRERVEVHALKGISFDVDEGELIGFLGPNGAGKSTTLKILTGVLHPTSGEVDVDGFVPWKQRKKYVGRIGAVFGQKSQLVWDIPPIDSFMMNRAIYGIPGPEFEKTLSRLSAMLDVSGIMKQPTRNLSLGERMKCEFIMAMLHRPRIVFLDEPTIGLDVIAKQRIRDFIQEMNRTGVTFILTTHDLGDVERLARRIILINRGDIIFDNRIEELRRYFGSKKRIRLQTAEPLDDLAVPGLTMTEERSATDADYELDLSITNVNTVISRVTGHTQIRDISIEEIAIESVVRQLYEEQ